MNTVKDYVNLRLTHADKLAEATGCPLELYDCKKYKPMKDLKIYGESVQEGTPSPQMPIEVQSVGEKSVNLVKDVREVFKDFLDYTELTEDGRECIRIKSAGSAEAILDFEFKENTQYTISFDFKCKYDRSGVSLDYDVPFAVYYTDGSVDKCSLSPIDDTWNKRVLTTKAEKTVSHISGISFDYRVYNYIDINTFQIEEGTNVTEYRPYGKYKIPVTISGKNLATAYDVCKNLSTYKETTLDGKECVSYRSNYGFSYAYTDYPFKENTQYTVSFYVKSVKNHTLTGNSMIMGFTYTDGTAPSFTYKDCIYNNNDGVNDIEWRKVTITSRVGKTVKGFGTDGNHYSLTHYIDVNTFQFEEGAVATEYDAYVDPVTTNIYLDEPLRKIGDYADYMDFKNNKVVRKIDKHLVVNEYADYWHINIDTEDTVSIYRNVWFNNIYLARSQVLSNYFPYYVWENVRDNVNVVWSAGVSGGFKISTDLIDGYDYSWSNQQKIEPFLKWAQSIGLDWYLVRRTPREEYLNLDIPKLRSKTSIIEVNTSLAPSKVFGKYIKK